MSFKYFYERDKDDFQFYRMPVQAFKSPPCKDLTAEAKLLITYMLDRRALSVKSGWHDEQGRVYIYYPLHQICEDLSVGKQKAVHMLDELEKAELIKRTRQGMGRPSRIYVGFINNPLRTGTVRNEDFISREAVRNEDFSSRETVRNEDFKPEEVRKPDHEKYDNQSPKRALDRLIEECKRDSTNTNSIDTEYIYTKSDSGEIGSYDRPLPKTREEVLEEYRKMKARGEVDMTLVELMLLATNDTVGEPRHSK